MKDLTNKNVIHVKKEGIDYLQFRKLLEYDNIINHAYCIGLDKNFRTARTKDKKPLTEEEYDKAVNDYKTLCNKIGTNYNNVVKPNQNHTKNVMIIENKINKDMPDFNLQEYNNIDGLITNKKDLILSTTNADCILLLMFDPVKKVIANVHSGWKGTLQRISVEAICNMKEHFASNPKDIICCVCPSIRKCHFEVSEDVYNLFVNEFKELDTNEFINKINDEKWSIDTVKINEMILKKAGLNTQNIIDSEICSVCNSDVMHSYRVEKEEYGLETAIINIK